MGHLRQDHPGDWGTLLTELETEISPYIALLRMILNNYVISQKCEALTMKIAWLFVRLTLPLLIVIPVYPTAVVDWMHKTAIMIEKMVVKVSSITRDLVWLDASVSVD